MKRFGYFVVVFSLIMGVLVSACGQKTGTAPTPAPAPTTAPAPSPAPAPQPSGWDSVLAAAKKEGTVTIYNVLGAQLTAALKEGMKQYGINLEGIGGSGGELELKIITEQRAKSYNADLFMSGWTNINNVVKGGFGQPVTTALPSLVEKVTWTIDPGKYESTKSGYIFAIGFNPSIIINTDLVRKGEIVSWQDLLDPKWRDRMVVTDGRTGSGPGATVLWAWSSILGEDYWKKIAAQRPTLYSNYDLPVSQVVLGDKAVAILPVYSRVVAAIKAGAPIQIVNLKEGTTAFVNGVGYVKNAPHPNAAMVLLNWMFSKEGQAAIGRATDTYTARKDVPQDWFRIPELNPGTFTLLEPPTNLDPDSGGKGAEFAKKIFGAR